MKTETLLNDGTISLRALEPSDLDAMIRWENDTRLWSAGSQGAPLSRHAIAEYIANYDADIFAARQLRLIVVENATGNAAGAVDLYDFDPLSLRAGIGIIINENARGHGFGTRALTLLWQYASLHLGMNQLWAMTAIDNTAACHAFTSAGFTTAGRLRSWIRRGRQWVDALMFQRLNIEA